MVKDISKQTSEAFGNLEFEYDLKDLLDRDPIAALGFDPDKAKFNLPQGSDNAQYLHKDRYNKDGKLLGKKDDVLYGPDYGASKDTIIHEFRHRGHKLLRDEIDKNPKAFAKKYGQDVVEFLTGEFLEAKGVSYLGDRHEEFRTELGDNLDATFNKPRPDTAKLAENMLGEDSKLFSQEELEKLGTKFYLQNFDKFKGRMLDTTELVTKEYQEKYRDILTRVRQAALDILQRRKGYAEGGDVNQETEELFGQRKGMGYGELLVDNILGLDNEYESFGEKLGKGISEDYLGFLKQAAIGAYEGAKEFVSDPVGVVTDVATDIKDSVQRLGTEDLDSRIRRMYGVGYSEATDEQVNQAREAVLGDALTALELVPAAKGVQVVGKAAVDAVPSGIKADVVGQTKAMLSGDKEFLTATPTDRATTQSLSAAVPESTDKPRVPDTKPKSQVNPLFKDYGMRTADLVISFYNPVKSALENLPMKKSGMTGKQIKAYLTKRAPNVNQKTLKYSKLLDRFEDNKVYKKEDAVLKSSLYYPQLIGKYLKGSDVKYPNNQRQRMAGVFKGKEPDDYYEVAIQLDVPGEQGVPFPDYHYGPNNLAHSRASVYRNVILLEEIQSDAVQSIDLVKRKRLSKEQQIKRNYDLLLQGRKQTEIDQTSASNLSDERLKQIATDIAEIVDNREDSTGGFDEKFQERLEKLEESLGVRYEGYRDEYDPYDMDAYLEVALQELFDAPSTAYMDDASYYPMGYDFLSNFEGGPDAERAATAYNLSPEQVPVRLTDTIKQNLLMHIIEGKRRGIDNILLPPLDKLVEVREGASREGLSNTYEAGFNKAIRELNNELNNKIKVGRHPIQYPDGTQNGTLLKIDEVDVNPRRDVPRFNKGGSVMDQEMNNLMQQGGLKTDGMDKDPVSGNPVPPGSLAKEVRDDVPAQLSEGEYVVPADVVRYFGVGYFEKLRDKAKSGLNKMEQTGRIGGEPMTPQQMPQMPPMPQGVPQQMQAGGYVMSGYAPGGDVSSEVSQVEAAKTFDPTQYATPGMSYINRAAQLQGSPFGGITYVEYISADGTTRIMIPFINGVAQVPIPEGYIPTSEYQAQEDVESEDISGDEEQQQQQQQQRDDTPTQQAVQEAGTTGWETDTDFENFTNEDWLKWSEEQGSGNMLKFLPGTAGLIAGTVSELDAVADMRSGIAIAAVNGASDETLAEMQKMLEKYEDRLSPFEKKIDQGKLIPTSGYKQVLSHLNSKGYGLSEEEMGQIQSRLEDGSITSEDVTYLRTLRGATEDQFASREEFEQALQDVAPPSMEYNPETESYQSTRDEDDPFAGLRGGTASVSDSGVNVFTITDPEEFEESGGLRPVLRPDSTSSSGTTTGSSSSGSGRNTFVQDLANLFTPFDDQEYVGGELKKTSSTAKKTAKPTPAPKKNTTNDVNRTGSDVTIGKTSPSGRDAGDGFVWEKKAGTNALTRKWVGN